jgi:hypothetical protein
MLTVGLGHSEIEWLDKRGLLIYRKIFKSKWSRTEPSSARKYHVPIDQLVNVKAREITHFGYEECYYVYIGSVYLYGTSHCFYQLRISNNPVYQLEVMRGIKY